jgi:hypothetical protein
MNFRRVFGTCALLSLFVNVGLLHAFETDQYNLPPVPLADIGDEVSEYVEENVQKAISKINAEIILRQRCLEGSSSSHCDSREDDRARLEFLRSNDAVALAVFKLLGDGIIPFTRSQTWINSHKFRAQPARYKTSYRQSIFVLIPTDYLTISPTVDLYGSSFGTDKIAHIFQQGYTYYKIRSRALGAGKSEAEAIKKAVKWGRIAERTYYGTLVGGVFSNADLAANFFGMRFYEGLTKDLQIGGVQRPAAVILKNGIWELNPKEPLQLLKPFISDHLNEALNPSIFMIFLRSSVRGVVKKQSCPQWRAAFPNRTQTDYQSVTSALATWHGEDYGFRQSDRFVTIANTCF